MRVSDITKLRNRFGFTIIEVMIAAGVLGIGCIGVLAMLVTAQSNNVTSNTRTHGVILAEQFAFTVESEARAINKRNEITSAQPILNMINSASDNNWVKYGAVNEIGQLATGGGDAGLADNLPVKYCVGFFKRAGGGNINMTGAIRVYWRSDGKSMTADDCASKENSFFAKFDTLSTLKSDAKSYDFASVPLSISWQGTSN